LVKKIPKEPLATYLMLQRVGAFNIDVSGKTGNERKKSNQRSATELANLLSRVHYDVRIIYKYLEIM
jgi:hypothetical protein